MQTANEIAEGIIELLEKRGMIHSLPQVISLLSEHQASNMKFNVAIVRTAVEMKSHEKEMIKDQLSEMFGRPLQIEEHIDESVVGGMYIQVGDTVLDYTISTQLKQVQEYLEN
jgi:F-type H+-transporting ATPase subunit delta